MPKPAKPKSADVKKLSAGTGPAGRVEGQVQALVSPKPEERRQAYRVLSEQLFKPGVPSAAAPAAIGPLCEVFAKGAEGSHRAGWLIGDTLAGGHLYALEHGGDAKSKAARAEATAHKETLLRALKARDVRARSAAAFALAFLPDIREASLPALRESMTAEPDPVAKASMLVALGVLGTDRPPAEALAPVDSVRREHAADLVGGAAAFATWLLVPKTPLTDLAHGLLAFMELDRSPEAWPWGGDRYDRPVAAVARRLEAVSPLIKALAEALVRRKAVGQATALLLLDLGEFAKQWDEFDIALPEELSKDQREIATALAVQDGLTDLGWGIPPSGRDRRRWLGQSSGPLERTISLAIKGKKYKGPIWKAWRMLYEQRASSDDVPESIRRALSPDELVEALGEVGMIAYGIVTAKNGRRPSEETIAKAVDAASPSIGTWARSMADEVVRLIEKSCAPELGGIIGAQGEVQIAVSLALLRANSPFEERWTPLVPVLPPDIARRVWDKVSPRQREECLWGYARAFQEPNSTVGLTVLMQMVDLAPSERIADVIVAKLRATAVRNVLGKERVEGYLETLRALAEHAPGVRKALDRAPSK
jgi:hypothetical protein